MSDIIIIGAGASGLMTARQLAKQGKKVTVLEARDRIGGRIHTVYNIPSGGYAELGAEFIHGDLPVTFQLLKEAGMSRHHSGGEMWRAKNGSLDKEDHFIECWDEFEKELKKLDRDMSINAFLDIHFSGSKYDTLKKSVRAYAAGYDTADPADASSLALRREWLEEDEGEQYKADGGYLHSMQFLAGEFAAAGGVIHLSSVVTEIRWQPGKVEVTTASGIEYDGSRIIITVPLGVLKLSNTKQGITFSPSVDDKMAAAAQMGMGAVIKVLLQFKHPFWLDKTITKGKNTDKMFFLFSDQAIPTWWTQYPHKNAWLTGWLGGPDAYKLKDVNETDLLAIALSSLAAIFNITEAYLKEELIVNFLMNWTADPFARGSYTYETVATHEARKILQTPVSDTIFFAGEALYDGPEMGTVEAALASGLNIARLISEQLE